MPFVDTNDDVFLGEKSFATRMRLSTVMRPFRAKNSPRTWRAGRQRPVCPEAGVPNGREERVPSE
jgi:hypothetical protein